MASKGAIYLLGNYILSRRRIAATLKTITTSSGWPSGFIHIKDLSGGGGGFSNWFEIAFQANTGQLITVGTGSPTADIAESLTVNEQGFDPSAAAATAAQAEAFRPELAGCAAVTVRLAGTGVSAGMYTAVRDGVTELTGIATLEPYRRRGLAGLVVATLAGLAFDSGADLAFLTTSDERARGAYRRAGFAEIDGPRPGS